MEEYPGINGESFKLTLNKDYFNSLPKQPCYIYKVKIIRTFRSQWYWRILHYLTFKKFFDRYYELEIIDGPILDW